MLFSAPWLPLTLMNTLSTRLLEKFSKMVSHLFVWIQFHDWVQPLAQSSKVSKYLKLLYCFNRLITNQTRWKIVKVLWSLITEEMRELRLFQPGSVHAQLPWNDLYFCVNIWSYLDLTVRFCCQFATGLLTQLRSSSLISPKWTMNIFSHWAARK